MLDLAPFGFTPTESSAYGALLELGPSSGYAVARALSIARANAYQALDALVAKGAAVVDAEHTPRRYHAVQPRTVFARIADAETRKLDQLERELLEQPRAGTDLATRIHGDRAINDLVVRAIIRTDGQVHCLAAADRLSGWAPAIRARAAAGRALDLWSADGRPADLAVPPRPAEPDRVRDALGDDPVLLIADGVFLGRFVPEAEGMWSEAPAFAGLATAALLQLTGMTTFNHPDG